MPRYTILQHNHPFLHWDLLLETSETKIPTWRLLQAPPCSGNQAEFSAELAKVEQKSLSNSAGLCILEAESLPAHRREYLDYVGPVSGNRGHVEQWDTGWYVTLFQTATLWEFRLEGTRWEAFASLHLLNQPTEHGADWKLTLMLEPPEKNES